jgi:hypothetical protein
METHLRYGVIPWESKRGSWRRRRKEKRGGGCGPVGYEKTEDID